MKRLCFYGLMFFGVVASSKASDWELWLTFHANLELTEKWGALWEVQERIQDHGKDPYLFYSRQGVYWDPESWLQLGVNYFHANREQDGPSKASENRLELRVVFKHEYKGFNLSLRNQFDSRFAADTFQERYRLRLRAVRTVFHLADRPLAMFGTNEFFFNLSEGGQFQQNRLTAGFAYSLGHGIHPVIYYRLRSQKSSDEWLNTNVIGVMMRVQF